jgi:hypothetical protein
MATVADLYAQALGRSPDAGGLAYWESMFGPTVDPTEAATFLSVAKVIEPDVVQSNLERLTQVADLDMGLFAPVAAPVQAPVSSVAVAPKTVNELYQTFYGTPGDPSGVAYWGGADRAITPKDAASFILWAGKDPSIANKSTGLTVDQAYETYLGFKPDQTARNYWTGGNPDEPLTTAQLAAITSEAYGLNKKDGGGIFGSGIGPDVSWVDLRDNLEAASVIAGNYFLPGSSLLTSRLVTEGAQENLNTEAGRIANAAAGIAGGVQGNVSNYGRVGETLGLTGPATTGAATTGAATSNISADVLAAANATSDPIATLNALQGFTYSDLEYLSTLSGMTPEILAQATANNALLTPIPREVIPAGSSTVTPATAGTVAGTGITLADVIKTVPLVGTVTSILNPPKPPTTPTTPTGFGIVPIPSDWRSPTYSAPSAPVDFNSLFTDQNLLAGTQWQGLPNQRNVTFNDIFASGQQQTPMGQPVNINQIVSSILGQNTVS